MQRSGHGGATGLDRKRPRVRRNGTARRVKRTKLLLWDVNLGTSLPDLANTLGIRPNTLSQRISRLRKGMQKTLDWNRTKAPISGPNGKPNARRRGPGRAVPLHGGDRAA